MNIVQLSQIVGVISILIFFVLNFYVVVDYRVFLKVGRVASLWITIYVFFLFLLRVLSLAGIGTVDDLRIISGISSLIPLVMVVWHLLLNREMDKQKPLDL